jgi:hypothetical protein
VNGRSDYSFFELGGIDVVLGIASGCGIGAILMQEKKLWRTLAKHWELEI